MTEEQVVQYILNAFDGVETQTAYGYLFFHYGAERKLPFATIASSDSEYDAVSNLDRPGVYRLNIGLRPETYTRLIGARPAKTGTGGVVAAERDFTALDTVLPHPDYAPQSWVCILSPTVERFDEVVKPLLAEAYGMAVGRRRPPGPG